VQLTSNRSVRISPAAAFLLVAFMGGQSVGTVLSDVSQTGVADPESALTAMSWLRDAGFLVDGSDEGHRWAEHILRTWGKYEWHATADYHLSTFDFPFVDYSQPGGIEFDLQLMSIYESEEPDLNRTKRYRGAAISIPAPTAKAVLDTLQQPFTDAWRRFCAPTEVPSEPTGRVTRENLLRVMAVTFGQLRTRTVSRNGERRDLIRKTSPSGGSRHPIEAYAAVINVEDVPPGFYHFCVETNSLDRIADLPSMSQLEVMFDGPFRSRQELGVEPSVIIVMTSVFDRVMWRYREPRTFRTQFIDAGHLNTTLFVASAAHGYASYSQHGLMDAEIEQLAGVDHLDEGVVYGVAIGVPGTSPEWKKLKKE
jgi:SagB-type dehydrogenase family enzyme